MSFKVKFGQWIARISFLVSSASLLIMMLLVTANVILRSFFSAPLLGTVELVGMTGVFMISFALPYTEAEREHLTISIMVSRLPKRLQSIFSIAGLFISMLVVVMVFWAVILQFLEAVVTPGLETQALGIPKPPFLFVLMCGCVVLFGFLFTHFIEELGRLIKK